MEDIEIDLNGCARCHGEGHQGIVFKPLTHPVTHDGVEIASHWAMFPVTDEPILMRIQPCS